MRIGLLGFGTVGGGVGHIVTYKKAQLEALIGEPVTLVAALVKDVNDHRGTAYEALVTENPADILDNEGIDVVFEALGGIEVPFDFLSRAIKSKKHVITANKAVICAHYPELQALAKENGVLLSVEACVGGGIPIISTLNDHLLFGDTRGIHGILNGTGNYILSKIERESCSFEEALKEAQSLGYAEQIPDDDVDGFDAARKLLILTALIHNAFFKLDQVARASIRTVAPVDFDLLKSQGKTLRYVVSCEKSGDEGTLFLSARPLVVPIASPFGQTFGPDNTVVFDHEHLNQLSLKGPGAGKLPTANAMVGDLVRLKGLLAAGTHLEKADFLDQRETLLDRAPLKAYYLRAKAEAIAALDGDLLVSIQEYSTPAGGDQRIVRLETTRPSALFSKVMALDAGAFIAEM